MKAGVRHEIVRPARPSRRLLEGFCGDPPVRAPCGQARQARRMASAPRARGLCAGLGIAGAHPRHSEMKHWPTRSMTHRSMTKTSLPTAGHEAVRGSQPWPPAPPSLLAWPKSPRAAWQLPRRRPQLSMFSALGFRFAHADHGHWRAASLAMAPSIQRTKTVYEVRECCWLHDSACLPCPVLLRTYILASYWR